MRILSRSVCCVSVRTLKNSLMCMSYLYSKLPETCVSPHIGTGGSATIRCRAARSGLLGFSLATDAAIEPNESRAGTRKDPKRQGECPVSNIIDLDHCNSALTFADLASTCVKANLRVSQELI